MLTKKTVDHFMDYSFTNNDHDYLIFYLIKS